MVVDELSFGANAPLEIVMMKIEISLMGQVPNGDVQLIAGEVLVGPGSQWIDDLAEGSAALVEIAFAKKVVADDVVVLYLVVFKNGGHPFQSKPVVDCLDIGQAKHIGLVVILFLALEIDIQPKVGGNIWREDRGGELLGLRNKVEARLGQGAQQLQVAAAIELPGQQSLDIGRRWGVGTFCLLAGEEAAIGSVAGADQVSKTAICGYPFEMKSLFEEAEVDGTTEAGGLAVLDVEGGRHLISVPRLEPASVKANAAGQLRVDEAESFLLSVVDEVGPEDLKIVHIDQVLVVITAADGILGGQFVIGADEDLDETFDPAGRGGDIDGVPWVDLDQAGFTGRLLVRHGDGSKRFGASFHADDDPLLFFFVEQEIALFRSVARIGKHKRDGFFGFDADAKIAGIGSHD